MSHIDFRGFVYSLEPVQRQREWRLDASLSKQRATLAQLSGVSKSRDHLDNDIAELALRTRQGALVDPAAHLRLLDYLSNLHDQRAALTRRIDQLRSELRRSGDEVLACKRNLDVIEEHRDSDRAEYGLARARVQQVQVDDEWITRAHYRGAERGT